jgi:hypothetical protein
MHKKYARDGLAAVSVSLDDPNEEGAQKAVLKFLESQKATFPNLILNEQVEVWQAKLKIDGPPAVFVFDRDGKVAKKFTDEPIYAEVQKLVPELLKKK